MSTQLAEKAKEAPLSRLGRKPVEIPAGVKVNFSAGTINVEGSRGKLSWTLPALITAKVEGNQVKVSPTENGPHTKPLHGLSRKLILNMIEGVTKGFSKRLMIEGVGYRSQLTGNKLTLSLGFSHPVVFDVPAGITIKADPKVPTLLIVEGNDKQKVGEVAARIRAIKPPEPYKGTGIRYDTEVVKRKAGKAAVGSTGAAGGGGGAKK